jgi:hypothetical protein
LPVLRQEIQKCGVCEGTGQLAKDHWYLEFQAVKQAPLARSRADVIETRNRLWESYQGRCQRCGGYGKVIVVKDAAGQAVALLHYDDRGMAPDALEHLTKMNATA